MKYPASELVLNNKGQVYHLGLSPEQIAENVILVGDQDRVNLVSQFFEKIEHQSQHREFVCHTGTYKGKRISVLSTGIGTDNLDIAINELDALVNIDLEKREDNAQFTSLNLVRIGTCGILQAHIPVHSYILSTHAYGLDNIAHFYPADFTEEEKKLNDLLDSYLQLPEKIKPYFVSASEELINKLNSEKTFKGITVTSSGFYAPQGRSLRLGLASENLNENLALFNYNGLKVNNFEMESSALFFLGKNLGHKVCTICLGIANRPNREFSKGYSKEMNELIQYVLERI
ncbi:MAG: nucleoside phosphorylase [Flavobacteriia bacterium]|nr:nucleoside phosphorylase [Flavobacteriia bacterium]